MLVAIALQKPSPVLVERWMQKRKMSHGTQTLHSPLQTEPWVSGLPPDEDLRRSKNGP